MNRSLFYLLTVSNPDRLSNGSGWLFARRARGGAS